MGVVAATLGGVAYMGRGKEKAAASHTVEKRAYVQTFDLGDVAHMRAGGLGSRYLDYHEGTYPEQITTSFAANLVKMWRTKVDRAPELSGYAYERCMEYAEAWEKGPEAVGVPDVPEGLTTYPYFTRMVNRMSELEREVLSEENFDWKAFAEGYGFTNEYDLQMVAHLASRATGHALMAYLMTEIMPYSGKDAENNIAFLNFMIQNAGIEFLNRIPALGDDLLSVGEFQPTKYCVEGTIARPHTRRSVNQYVTPKLRVPDRIADFKPTAEHPDLFEVQVRAATLFGLQHVADAARALKDIQGDRAAIDAVADMDPPTFASVLAMHHYQPATARSALVAWAKDASKGMTGKPYYAYAPEKVSEYGKRSYDNCLAVDAYFAEP